MALKSTAYLTLEEMGVWLKIPAVKLQAGPSQDPNLVAVLESLINSACDKVEKILDTPVLTRTFQEDHDGSNSNVIKPHHWPVTEITELKIDYNRAFGSTSIVPQTQYFLRGGADTRQVTGDPTLRIIGNDLVLRDDNEHYVLGRIFSGSVLGAIRLKYKAGWGATPADLPADIVLATKQLVEYWYLLRENREINIKSRSVKGESSTTLVDGIPKLIYDMLSGYQDVSLGDRPVSQRNQFSL